MSDSDRSERNKNVAAAFSFAALLGLAILAFTIGEVSGIDAGRNQVASQDHYERVKENKLQACGGVDKPATVECVEDAIEAAYDQSDSRQDLYAQQDMAKWAAWLLLVTLFTFILSVGGLWALLRTIWQGDESNKIARNAISDGNRAWIKVDVRTEGPLIITDMSERMEVAVLYKNIGNSVAKYFRVWAYLTNFDPMDDGDESILKRRNIQSVGSQFSSHVFPGDDMGQTTLAQGFSVHTYKNRMIELTNGKEPEGVPLFLIVIAKYKLAFDGEDTPLRETEIIREVCLPNGNKLLPVQVGEYEVRLTPTLLGSGNVT